MKKVSICHTPQMASLFMSQIDSLGFVCVNGSCSVSKTAFGCFSWQSTRLWACMCAWMYACICESRTTIQPPGLPVLTPIFQLLYSTLNPVNLLLFTLSPSSCLLCLYLSLSHTLMLIYSPSIALLLSLPISLQLPTVHLSFSRTQALLCS